MAKTCPSCGRPLGFFRLNLRERCGVCGRELCWKCREWLGAEWVKGGGLLEGSRMIHFSLCSKLCALAFYWRWLRGAGPDTGLVLFNEGNIGVGLEECAGSGRNGRCISIAHARSDPRRFMKPDSKMPPEVAELYKQIREDIMRKGLKFREEFFVI